MSHHAPHPSDETLVRAIDGELSPPGIAALEAHLDACDGCRARLQAMRSAAEAAVTVCRGDAENTGTSLAALRARLRVGLAEESSAPDRPAISRIFGVRVGAVAAAVLTAMVVVGIGARYVQPSWTRVETPVEADALPIPALTPGAVDRVTADDLCAGRGPTRGDVSPAVREAVLRAYGMEGLPDDDYELDYLITPELGGSGDRRNLWPERYGARVWNARVKDELERLLPTLVCRGAVDLTTAQRDIATDWIAAYKKYFHTDRPVAARAQLVTRNGLPQ